MLHIKSDAEEFLEPHRLETIIRKWADHISVPITVARDGKDVAANEGTALWRKPKAEITEEQYTEFYRHLGHMFDAPWATLHWRAEGALEFTALLFVPSSKPFDFMGEAPRESRVRLHVRRMFITDEAGLLPPWLRFVTGVVDTEDLPLNVSREMLQTTPVLARIRKAVTNRVLSELKTKSRDESTEGPGELRDVLAEFRLRDEGGAVGGCRAPRRSRAAAALQVLQPGGLDVADGIRRPHEAGAGGDLRPARRRHGCLGQVAAAGGVPRARGIEVLADGRPGGRVLAGAHVDLRGEADPLHHAGCGRPVEAADGGDGRGTRRRRGTGRRR